MRTFTALGEDEKNDYVVLFADKVAATGRGDDGVAFLYDPETDDVTVYDKSYPVVVIVHDQISHITLDEARALRDALTEIVDA